jgi:hypothetical protein
MQSTHAAEKKHFYQEIYFSDIKEMLQPPHPNGRANAEFAAVPGSKFILRKSIR